MQIQYWTRIFHIAWHETERFSCVLLVNCIYWYSLPLLSLSDSVSRTHCLCVPISVFISPFSSVVPFFISFSLRHRSFGQWCVCVCIYSITRICFRSKPCSNHVRAHSPGNFSKKKLHTNVNEYIASVCACSHMIKGTDTWVAEICALFTLFVCAHAYTHSIAMFNKCACVRLRARTSKCIHIHILGLCSVCFVLHVDCWAVNDLLRCDRIKASIKLYCALIYCGFSAHNILRHTHTVLNESSLPILCYHIQFVRWVVAVAAVCLNFRMVLRYDNTLKHCFSQFYHLSNTVILSRSLSGSIFTIKWLHFPIATAN